MGLPDVISIDPLDVLPSAQVVVPGSKSLTNRALVSAAIGQGTTTLRGALWSEDTHVMVACLQRLEIPIEVEVDSAEPSNRTLHVSGRGGDLAEGGTREAPLELFVGNAGTAARFLTALVCLGRGYYRLHGVDRMHERPQAGLVQSLRQLGYTVLTDNDRLPLTVLGEGARPGKCQVDIAASSQFASALLLASDLGAWEVEFVGRDLEHSPYVRMTIELKEAFAASGESFQIEPDASSGSYFWGVNGLGLPSAPSASSETQGVAVQSWPRSGWQIDAEFPRCLKEPRDLSRENDLGDSIMTAIVLGALGDKPRAFTDLGRLRVQECERVVALRTELTKCGIEVEEAGDTLVVHPGPLRGATIETYEDHRVAMCFSLLALRQAGIRIADPSCVKKTFPTFFQKLATAPPLGLGATIRDGATGAVLSLESLAIEC